jgi:hypothetical protein
VQQICQKPGFFDSSYPISFKNQCDVQWEANMSSIEQLTQRVSYLEQLVIVAVLGGGPIPLPHWPPGGPTPDPGPTDYARMEALRRVVGRGDPPATDAARLEALYRAVLGGGRGDPPAADLARLSLAETETLHNDVGAAITRLQARQVEINARLKELRGQGQPG